MAEADFTSKSSSSSAVSDRALSNFEQYGISAQYDGVRTAVTYTESDDPAPVCAQKAQKLHSLMCWLGGQGFDSFNCHSTDIKANVLALLSDLANEVAVLAELASQQGAVQPRGKS